jgi:hypothetical protein
MPSQSCPFGSEQYVIVDRHVDGGVQYVVRGPRLGLVMNGMVKRKTVFSV